MPFLVNRNTALVQGQVSYWKLDGNSVDTITGAASTDTNISYVTGKLSKAASGNRGGIISSNSIGLYNFILSTGIFSINFWYKANSISDSEGLVTTNGNASIGFFVMKRNARLEVIIFSNGTLISGFISDPDFFADTDFHMVTVVGNGSNIKIYKDSIQFGSTYVYLNAPTASSTGEPLTIGGFPDLPFSLYGLTGVIDEVGIWNTPLPQRAVSELHNSSNGRQHPFQRILMNHLSLYTGVKASYRFNENTIDDISATYGTAYNMSYTAGINGKAAYFDGSSTQINLGTALPWQIIQKTTNWSFAFWWKPDDYTRGQYFIGNWNGTGKGFYCGTNVGAGVGGISLVVLDAGVTNVAVSGILSNNNWVHLAFVADGSNISIYRNGTNVYSFPGPAPVATNSVESLYIGSDAGYPGNLLGGIMDDLLLWDRTITQREINLLVSGRAYPF